MSFYTLYPIVNYNMITASHTIMCTQEYNLPGTETTWSQFPSQMNNFIFPNFFPSGNQYILKPFSDRSVHAAVLKGMMSYRWIQNGADDPRDQKFPGHAMSLLLLFRDLVLGDEKCRNFYII